MHVQLFSALNSRERDREGGGGGGVLMERGGREGGKEGGRGEFYLHLPTYNYISLVSQL